MASEPIVLGMAVLGFASGVWWTARLARHMLRRERRRATRRVAEREEIRAPASWVWTQEELFFALIRDRDDFEKTVLDAAGGHPLEPAQTAALVRIVCREPHVLSLSCMPGIHALVSVPSLPRPARAERKG
jgi:hypothetical protein